MKPLWDDKRKPHYVMKIEGVEVLACAPSTSINEKAMALKTRKWWLVKCSRCLKAMEWVKRYERR